jgi:hypothetical protein
MGSQDDGTMYFSYTKMDIDWQKKMILLLLAIEDDRISPVRLAGSLYSAGISVAALCRSNTMLGHSKYLFRLFDLPSSRSFRELARSLEEAVSRSGAELIIPGDEQAIILLQFLRRRRTGASLSARTIAVIKDSLGDPEFFAASLLKSNTVSLACKLGLKVPRGFTVTSAEEAVVKAESLGFPVFLKESFSWGGLGVVSCPDPDTVRQAFNARRPTLLPLRRLLKTLLGRHWYPTCAPIDIQSPISGQVAMFCGLAIRGQLLGGICAFQLECAYPQGPSTAVRISHDIKIAAASAKMILALGFNGFIGFDFIKPDDGGEPVFIECNPRPVPIAHLGGRLGVDLAVLLANYLSTGRLPVQPVFPQGSLDVILFPASLQSLPWHNEVLRDIPNDDPGFLEYYLTMHPADKLTS